MGRVGRAPRFQEKVMDEIVNLVQQRAGIDEGQARTAVDTVLSFVKDRLPEPMRGQIDGLVSRGGSTGGVGGASGSNPLGGLGDLGNIGGG